jgi:transcriptional regulator with XRE-family HTH domain
MPQSVTERTLMTDRRQTVDMFRTRLLEVIQRTGLSRSAFATRVGMDRSTLSQLLAIENDRLPRVETLSSIARIEQVSIDWLVGLSQEGPLAANVLKQSVEVEPHAPSPVDDRLERWHEEASGFKIRYVPMSLPDLLKTSRVIDYEYGQFTTVDAFKSLGRTQGRLELQRRSDSDVEVCTSVQSVEGFARGEGVWRNLELAARKEQLERMIELTGELYPGFRWFLYDSRNRFSVPFTVFGPQRAVLYVGQAYFVFNSLEHIRYLTKHFEDLICGAVVEPSKIVPFLKELLEAIGTETR